MRGIRDITINRLQKVAIALIGCFCYAAICVCYTQPVLAEVSVPWRSVELILMNERGEAQVKYPIKHQTALEQLTMTPEQIRQLIEQARDAWIAGDADAFAALFRQTGEFVVPGQVYRGPDAIRSAVVEFAAGHSNVAIDLHRVIIDSNQDTVQAVVEWHWEDTETKTGKRTQADDAIVVDIQAGQISRWREYIDTATPAT